MSSATSFAIAHSRSPKKRLRRRRYRSLRADNASVSSLRNCRGLTGATALFVPRVGTRASGKRFRQRVTAERGIRGILKDAPPSLRKAPAFPLHWRPLKPEPTRSLFSPFLGRNRKSKPRTSIPRELVGKRFRSTAPLL